MKEHKYNFRFEEPEGNQATTYSREIKDSLRNKDSSRAEKRKEKIERQNLDKKKE